MLLFFHFILLLHFPFIFPFKLSYPSFLLSPALHLLTLSTYHPFLPHSLPLTINTMHGTPYRNPHQSHQKKRRNLKNTKQIQKLLFHSQVKKNKTFFLFTFFFFSILSVDFFFINFFSFFLL